MYSAARGCAKVVDQINDIVLLMFAHTAKGRTRRSSSRRTAGI